MAIDAEMELTDCLGDQDYFSHDPLFFLQSLATAINQTCLNALHSTGNRSPLCKNNHIAVYQVIKPGPNGWEFYRYLCQWHSCPYEFHDYIRTYLPPGYRVVKIEKQQ